MAHDHMTTVATSWADLGADYGQISENSPVIYNRDTADGRKGMIVPRVIFEEKPYTYSSEFLKRQELREFIAPLMLESYQKKTAIKIDLDRNDSMELLTEVIRDVATYHKYTYEISFMNRTIYVHVQTMTL